MCATQEKTLKGEAGFDAYYAQLFKERWPSLRLQNSLEKFRDAKQKGDALYYEYWSK